jgi:hypothetical protein
LRVAKLTDAKEQLIAAVLAAFESGRLANPFQYFLLVYQRRQYNLIIN